MEEGPITKGIGCSSNGGERNLSPLWKQRGTKSWM